MTCVEPVYGAIFCFFFFFIMYKIKNFSYYSATAKFSQYVRFFRFKNIYTSFFFSSVSISFQF